MSESRTYTVVCMLTVSVLIDFQGSGLDVLERVDGLQVLIGNVSCVISSIQASELVVVAPAEPPVINPEGNAAIIVSLRLLHSSC